MDCKIGDESVTHRSPARLAAGRRAVSSLRRSGDPALVRTFGLRLGRGTIAPPQPDDWHQLVTAADGRAVVRTDSAVFPLIAGSGAWLPPGVAYSIELAGDAELRLLYFRAHESGRRSPALLRITPLLRELIARTVELGALDGRVGAQRRLAGVVTDEVSTLPEAQLHLPLPRSGAARKAAELLLGDVPCTLGLDDVAARCGVSRRTLERAFARELGIGLGAWQRRLRFAGALHALHAGASVTAAALDAGYAAPSAFIAAFKRQFAITPGGFFS